MTDTNHTMENLKDKLVEIHQRKLKEFKALIDQTFYREYVKNYKQFLDRLSSTIKDNECMSSLGKKLDGKITGREGALLELSRDLLFIEGFICNFIDFICYLLILDHHDLCDFIRNNKYVTSVEDIAIISMFSKIKFLNRHDFNELTKYYDNSLRDYRNAIAHHKYTIDENGHVWIKGERVNPLVQIHDIWEFIRFFDSLIKSL